VDPILADWEALMPLGIAKKLIVNFLASRGLYITSSLRRTSNQWTDVEQAVPAHSFRYFVDGQKMKPQGDEMLVRITTLHPIGWRNVVLDADGGVHDSWSSLGGPFVFTLQDNTGEAVEVAVPPPPLEPADEPK